MSANIDFSNCVIFARFHFSGSPHALRDFIYFLTKRRGGVQNVRPQVLGISNTFYTFSAPSLSISHVT